MIKDRKSVSETINEDHDFGWIYKFIGRWESSYDGWEKMKKAIVGESLMQKEERNTGAISRKVYMSYMKAGKSLIILPFLLLSLVLLHDYCAYILFYLE